MARRRSFRGVGIPGRGEAFAHVEIHFRRDEGARTPIRAQACIVKTGHARRRDYATKRCGVGYGRKPTLAAKAALRDLAKVLR